MRVIVLLFGALRNAPATDSASRDEGTYSLGEEHEASV